MPEIRQEAITVRFTTTYREVVAALRSINRAVPLVRRLQRLSWASIGLIAFLTLTHVLDWSIAVTILFLPVLILILFWIMPFQLALMTKRRSPYWNEEQFFEFSVNGIRTGGSASETVLQWASVMRIAEDRRFILFFSSDQAGHFIPKRSLSADQTSQLRSILQECAGSSTAASPELSSASPVAVQVRFELDPVEIARAGMVAARKAGGLWVSYAVIIGIMLWTTVPAAYGQWQQGGWGAISFSLVALGVAPLILVVFGIPFLSRWAARRALRTGPSHQGVQEVGIAAWGIRVAGPMYTGELKWPAFMKVAETDEFFLFFISKLQPVFVPKRLLEATDIAEIRTMVRAGMGEKAAVLSDD